MQLAFYFDTVYQSMGREDNTIILLLDL